MLEPITHYQNFINGEFTGTPEDEIQNFNPSNQMLLSIIPRSSKQDVDDALSCAKNAQSAWSLKPAIERANYLRIIAKAIRRKASELALCITKEQGKVFSLAKVEVNFTADYMDYMAEWARRIEGEVITSDRAGENIFLLRQPLGVVAGILPWNFPFLLIARKMAPALIMGNTIVIKPSEETPNNCYEFAKIVAESGLPAGVFNVVGGSGSSVGQQLISDKRVDLISFTGSVETGSQIMATAAKNITKLNLELGGKAPAIVLDDADIDLAVKCITASRVINTGQACNCAERIYVQPKVADEFTHKLKLSMEKVTYGDPLEKKNLDMGPLINEESLNKVARMVDTALNDGAEAITGGGVADLGKGYHYKPTVLVNCKSDMEIMKKEIFAPVLPIQIVGDLSEAIALSNNSEYGLTSSLYTRDLNKALQAANQLSFGETYINRENFEAMQGFHAGTRKSGIGGADGKHGLYEYSHTHVVYIQA